MVDRRVEVHKGTPEHALACWKHTVGLPEGFPHLNPLTGHELDPESKLYIGPMHEEVVEEIFDRVSGPSNVIFFKPGHGCTTLSRYVFNSLRQECVSRKLIPVRLAIEEMPTPPDALESGLIESEALRELQIQLLSNRWERPIGAENYRILRITLPSFPPEPIDREQADAFFDQTSQTELRVSLQVDLSSPLAYQNGDLYSQQLSNFGRAVRNFCSRLPSQPPLVSEMYFASKEAWGIFNSKRQLEADETEYPSYKAADIFAILSRHYRSNRDSSLACVIGSHLLGPHVSEDKPLVEIMRDFEQEILKRVGSPGEFYQLR